MPISTHDKYAIVIHEIDLRKGALHKRFVDALWSDFRPYPEESHPSNAERATRQELERLLFEKHGTYLVVVVQVSGELTQSAGDLVSWSWTVTVTAAPTPPPPPPTITWEM